MECGKVVNDVLPQLGMLPDCLIEIVPAARDTLLFRDRSPGLSSGRARRGPAEGAQRPNEGWRARPLEKDR